MSKLVALTGGIASGKSTVAARLQQCGAVVVDADVLARRAVEPGTTGFNRIARHFGQRVVGADGRLDRSGLASIVFRDSAARSELNAIVHPEVQRLSSEAFRAARAADADAVIVYDVPLLVEARSSDEFDHIVVVSAPVDMRRARLVCLRGLSESEADARIASQASDADRERIADTVIDTSGSLEETWRQVDELWAVLRSH